MRFVITDDILSKADIRAARDTILGFLHEHTEFVIPEAQTVSSLTNSMNLMRHLIDDAGWHLPSRSALVCIWWLTTDEFSVYQIEYMVDYWNDHLTHKTDTIIELSDEMLAVQLRLLL
jgi:hypothetical protein